MEYAQVRGKIKSGFVVASDKGKDERYPEGTLRQQFKRFLGRGLDLSNYFMGTINLDISPCFYEIKKLKHFFKNIDWSDFIPLENFIFLMFPYVIRIKDWFICPIPKLKKIISKSRI